MKSVLRLFAGLHALIALLFVLVSMALLGIAAIAGWEALAAGFETSAAQGLIEAIGLLAVAVVSLQIAQTITEEEVVREAHVSGPTRVRRFLSRFMVVVVVALAVEGLIGVFKGAPDAAGVLVAVGVMLAGWGVFIKLNRAAEELEPEAMEQAKSEDEKLE